MPEREELGHNDQELWETGPDGFTKKDPRQEVHWIFLHRVRDGEKFAYKASSNGGRKAIANLLKAARTKKGLYPIVELASDGYDHRDKRVGWVDTPFFRPCGWKPYAGDGTNGTVAQLEAPKTDVAPLVNEGEPAEVKANPSLHAGPNDPFGDMPF